uniref:Uncharacterized protein n=1 Tax=Sphaerodactylus townsendi TaxID=933632 RepID=A0ACB8ENK7_9SAUR
MLMLQTGFGSRGKFSPALVCFCQEQRLCPHAQGNGHRSTPGGSGAGSLAAHLVITAVKDRCGCYHRSGSQTTPGVMKSTLYAFKGCVCMFVCVCGVCVCVSSNPHPYIHACFFQIGHWWFGLKTSELVQINQNAALVHNHVQ